MIFPSMVVTSLRDPPRSTPHVPPYPERPVQSQGPVAHIPRRPPNSHTYIIFTTIMTNGNVPDIKEGDDVAWKWGSGHPSGTVAEVSTDPDGLTITSQKGNKIHKKGSDDNPAVHVERENGNDVVKRASELEVLGEGETEVKDGKDVKADSADDKEADRKDREEEEPEIGDKRKKDQTDDTETEQADAEEDTGKTIKKANTSSKSEAGQKGAARSSATNKKSKSKDDDEDEELEDADADADEDAEADNGEGKDPQKVAAGKKGGSSNKKSDATAKKPSSRRGSKASGNEEVTGDAPSTRTRSKAKAE
ncbi:hypothetical protein G7K_1889-t1 [Saitoella complicata NRRL Y-17804]|uniref:Hypervirulence associated protein TUDOR domain-containing protein n=1 Tax=Saitoella complicata (strain BCRC 22490 / CBS 7301 / JCM 7358 / NBRC 10748 / NRRL Y-17804) TaxID=698492 RepID=A0A0E9NE50_SAICN|nr:hypothetical protein G7K_1889-t1 [Saitoella complicata NRRL Y-17804]